MTLNTYEEEQYAVQQIRDGRQKIYDQLSKMIVGQEVVIEQLLISLFAGGNCLITGAPGLAKTLLVRSIAEVFDLNFRRIQFTPDLMPADITGTEILQETDGGSRSMQFVKGPIFAGAARPPSLSEASRIVTLNPRSARRRARVMPRIPPPTIPTFLDALELKMVFSETQRSLKSIRRLLL